MRKFLCQLQFNGKNYLGYQINGNSKTIQLVLQNALKNLFGQDIIVEGCSRTDSGVSANKYYMCFVAETKLPPDRVAYKLNRFLPNDIQCQFSKEVDLNFDLRQSIKSKTYLYSIYDGEHIKPLLNRDAIFVKGYLNTDQMQKCANELIGTHNFKSFCNINADTKTFIRTLYDIKVLRQDNLIKIYLTADGFLYNMVRVVVGTLVECGKGNLSINDIKNLLTLKDRSKNPAKTMQSKALLLYNIDFK